MRTAPMLSRMGTMAIMAVGVVAGLTSSAEAASDPVDVRPDPVQFSTTELGRADAASVIFTNEIPYPIRIDILPEPPESAFSYRESSCSELLPPRASCRITVRFRPERWGLTTGHLVYTLKDSSTSRYVVRLRGTALRPGNDNDPPDNRLSVADSESIARSSILR